MTEELRVRVAALLERLIDAGCWYHAALEIEPHEDGENLKEAIRAVLAEIREEGPA